MRNTMMRRVVVTGMGIIGAHGDDSSTFFQALRNGENRIGPINPDTHFDSDSHPQTKDKPVVAVRRDHKTLAAMAGVDKPDRYDRHQLFAVIAAKEAMDQAGFAGVDDIPDRERFGCIGGTGDGGLASGHEAEELTREGRKLTPFANVKELPNLFSGLVAQAYGLQGVNLTHCTACAAGAHAIMQAADVIKLGENDVVLVVGAEAAITKWAIASFAGQRALGSDSLPFSINRNGFVMGEGAAALVLEDYEHATKRGAVILAELIGYGRTGDGNIGKPIVAPDAGGGYRAVSAALGMAGISAYEVDYLNTHGTATPEGDKAEMEGTRRWAGNHAANLLVSSTKSFTGHWLGAAGVLEAALCIRMMNHGEVLPTRGLTLDTIADECSGVQHVTRLTDGDRIETVLSNSFGFGGTNASLIFQRVD